MADILSLGILGLKANQAQLSTASHNISNAATEGFSRQKTELVTPKPQSIGGRIVGSGVNIGATYRILDEILVGINRDNISNSNFFEAKEELAEQLDTILSSTDIGVSDSINDFFKALQTLKNEPGSTQTREVLISTSKSLVTRVNNLDTRLSEQVEDINTKISDITTKINSITNSLQRINLDIIATSNLSSSSEPNDLKDQRDLLLNQLAELVSVRIIEQGDGNTDVFIGNGQGLLVGGQVSTLDTARNPNDPSRFDIRINNGVTPLVITEALGGGELGGLTEYRNEMLDPAQRKLGKIIMTLAMTFNEQHKKGIDANGDLGANFFNDYNDFSAQSSRSLANSLNTGNGVLTVAIDDIVIPTQGPYTLTSAGTGLITSTTLDTVDNNELTINGTVVRATVAGDDLISTTDNAGSAIAIAAAINDSGIADLTASVKTNAVYLGAYTAGPIIAGDFVINGANVVPASTSTEDLVIAVNALFPTTGVKASASGNNITLFAEDGRNIQLATAGGGNGTFARFDTTGGALDQVQRGQVTITSSNTAITIAGNAPLDAGFSAGTTPAALSSLTDSDYQLTYNGATFTLTRSNDNVIVATSNTTTIQADGITINVDSGTVNSGDIYIIRATNGAGQLFDTKIDLTSKLAMASPIKVQGAATNTSQSAKLIHGPGDITNTTGVPAHTASVLGNAFTNARQINPPIKIEFFNDVDGNPKIMRIFNLTTGEQIGPDQIFEPDPEIPVEIFPLAGVNDATGATSNPSYTYDPGYRVRMSGAPQAGDIFTITFNEGALGDNYNAISLVNLQNTNILDSGTVTYQDSYNELVARVGALTQTAQSNFSAADGLYRDSNARLQGVSGVNLDEEAVNLIRYQQGYRACAQVITIGSSLFDTLINAVAR